MLRQLPTEPKSGARQATSRVVAESRTRRQAPVPRRVSLGKARCLQKLPQEEGCQAVCKLQNEVLLPAARSFPLRAGAEGQVVPLSPADIAADCIWLRLAEACSLYFSSSISVLQSVTFYPSPAFSLCCSVPVIFASVVLPVKEPHVSARAFTEGGSGP